MDTIFKFRHSIMFTLTLQISKLTKAVVLNSFPHGRLWQFVYKENVRCTRLMQRSLQVVIRQKFSPSTNINSKRISITRIYFAFGGGGEWGGEIEMTD